MERTHLLDVQDVIRNDQRFLKRYAPPLGLFLLAPLCAEYLIGYLDSTGLALVTGLIFFAPLYGGAALLIREVTRRTGRGWPTMLLLGFAFGVFQAGLIDHSLFNPSYGDFEQWEESLKPTYIPALGVSANYAQVFVMGHVIWSIGAPIALVEAFVPHRQTTPWLGKRGLRLTAFLYLFICVIFLWGHIEDEDFLPSISQLIGAAAVVVAFIAAAFRVEKRVEPTNDKPIPSPWLIGALTLVLLSLVTLIEIAVTLLGISDTEFAATWGATGIDTAVYLLLAVLVWRWSRRRDWGTLHILALTGGALLTRAWIAFLVEPMGEITLRAKLINNTSFALGVIFLLYMAARTVRNTKT